MFTLMVCSVSEASRKLRKTEASDSTSQGAVSSNVVRFGKTKLFNDTSHPGPKMNSSRLIAPQKRRGGGVANMLG